MSPNALAFLMQAERLARGEQLDVDREEFARRMRELHAPNSGRLEEQVINRYELDEILTALEGAQETDVDQDEEGDQEAAA